MSDGLVGVRSSVDAVSARDVLSPGLLGSRILSFSTGSTFAYHRYLE